MKRLNIPWNRADLNELYHVRNMNLDEVAAHYACSQEAARKAMIRLGVERKPAVNRSDRPHPNKARKMSQNGFWKGGTTMDGDYLMVKVPGHPFANSGGYVRKHRLVMEKKLGRYLTREEVVHHKDDDPSNNRPSNLVLYANNSEHLAATLKGKCPNWSEEGYQNMLQGAYRKAVKDASTRQALEAYARRHSVELFRFLRLLSKDQRSLLRKALLRGDFEFLPESWKRHVAACRIPPVAES